MIGYLKVGSPSIRKYLADFGIILNSNHVCDVITGLVKRSKPTAQSTAVAFGVNEISGKLQVKNELQPEL